VLVGAGYFFVWTVFGMAAFPLGVALTAVEMQQPALARAVPIAVGVVVIHEVWIAGTAALRSENAMSIDLVWPLDAAEDRDYRRNDERVAEPDLDSANTSHNIGKKKRRSFSSNVSGVSDGVCNLVGATGCRN
jgi:hypothetical protein